ncbi:HlyD family efflux transporter periplasmic adaptor subunit [Geothrix sp.]|jgi:cobalt-zinc-cadmium efflux system membrane fusion protein|uniref:efflux RND transporter periplasmic adaptor subunit n=1 Tax=Geothrix sp. TaxID=1962974 RepID=UPI0025BDB914|nr:HlyD family efflux transporter periplasmic adaptor subunit [Geothrix sp.]
MTAIRPTARLLPVLLTAGALLGLQACKSKLPAEGASPQSRAPEADAVPLKSIQEGLRAVEIPAPSVLQAWFPAEAAGDESARAILTAPVSGIVASAPAAPGRPVAKGAPLVTLRSPELAELKSKWLIAQARLRRAQAELAREQRLAAAQAGARRDLDNAEAEHAGASAEAESARIALQARGVTPERADGTFVLRAPSAGTVSTWKAQLGQGVSANEELGTFQAASASLAVVELSSPAPGTWKLGSRAVIRDDQRTWQGEVVGLPSSMGDMTHRLTYRLRLSGAPLPLPGTPLEIQVPLGQGVLLPSSALQQVEGAWGVFIQEGELARFRPVKRGPDAGRETLVLETLPTGAKVFTEGAYLLKSKLMRTKSGGGDE